MFKPLSKKISGVQFQRVSTATGKHLNLILVRLAHLELFTSLPRVTNTICVGDQTNICRNEKRLLTSELILAN